MQRLFPLLALLGLVWTVHPAFAEGDYEAGVAAIENGDIDAARANWEPLAEAGDARAQYQLGLLYAEGRGVGSNFEKATGLFAKAAAQGHVDAQFALGLMYERGQGVDQDAAEAMRLYRTAADAGHPDAQFFLGVASLNGDGTPVDEAEGVKWIKAAAAGGQGQAILTMGVLHGIGKGVPEDLETSYMWFLIADKRNLEGGELGLLRLRPGLSAEQIASAEARAAAWLDERK